MFPSKKNVIGLSPSVDGNDGALGAAVLGALAE
jgi:hypothetical protein